MDRHRICRIELHPDGEDADAGSATRVDTATVRTATRNRRWICERSIIDDIVRRIKRFRFPEGVVARERRNRGYTLYGVPSGAPVAGLRRARHNDDVDVLSWSAWKERRTTAGPFGRTVLPIDEALDFTAYEDIF